MSFYHPNGDNCCCADCAYTLILKANMRCQRQNLRTAQNGFTLVELLIVIVVISVLAAITIIAYNNIAQRAAQAVLKSDLSQAETQLETTRVDTGSYPLTSDVSSGAYQLKSSGATKLEYKSDGTSYLLTASSSGAKSSYCFGSTANIVSSGPCAGQIGYVPSGTWVVTTFAGSGVNGSADGTGTSAQFAAPSGVTVDSSGNLYIADTGSGAERIRKVTAAGVATTLAGSGPYGLVNGPGTSAQFYNPSGVAVDSSGNVYVADNSNNCIRKITPAGIVSTLAGAGPYLSGSTNGTGTAAKFNGPAAVAVDAAGNVYVADAYNNLIRKITSAGVVTTFAGSGVAGSANGTGTAAQFNSPYGITIDTSGNLYVADFGNYLIRKITSAGVVTTLAGSGVSGTADGTGASAQFYNPVGVAVDSSGNVYVTDAASYNDGGLIRKVTPAGVVTTIAGSITGGSVDGIGSNARFGGLSGNPAVDASGNIFVGDFSNHSIRKIAVQP